MRRTIACLLVVGLAAPGCATQVSFNGLRFPHRPASPARQADARPAAITRDYVERLPVGARVEVIRASGERFTATFMGVEEESIKVQKRTRIPEAPFLLPIKDLAAVALD